MVQHWLALSRSVCYVRRMTTRITKARAEKLWDLLHSSILTTHNAILEIIEAGAWEPLGYPTLRAAWADRMADLDLAVTPMIHVVYQMLAEDALDQEVADVVKGVQVGTVSTLRRQRDNGVPPEAASLYVRPAAGEQRSASRGTLFLHIGPDRLREWNQLAKGQEKSAADLAIEILTREFSRMAVPVG